MLLGGGIQSCGKKGDPRPPGIPPPRAISDLRAKIVEAGVILRWSVPDAKSGIQNFKIQRSDIPTEGAVCPACPREYNTVADISANDPALTREEGNILSYLDRRINAGYIYTYRIVVCDIKGLCSEASNIEEVRIFHDLPQKERQTNK
jgi:hypothetical protein